VVTPTIALPLTGIGLGLAFSDGPTSPHVPFICGLTHVAYECIGARGRQILDVQSAPGRIIRGHLHRRISGDEVRADDISQNCGGQKETVRIPKNRVLLNDVVASASAF
jgi:hypothetical protein